MPGTLLIVLLICTAPIDADRCTRRTADDVHVLGRAPTPIACLMQGAASAAREAPVGDGRVSVVRCERG